MFTRQAQKNPFARRLAGMLSTRAMNQPMGTPTQQFMPLGEALMLADRYRGEGRLVEAEALCRRTLEAKPDIPEAEHLLGVIAHQNGKLSEAIEHVQRAVKFAPHVALYHANLGEMLRLTGTSSHGESVMKFCNPSSSPSDSLAAIGWIDLRRPSNNNPRTYCSPLAR